QVENTVFRVPIKKLVDESNFFKQMFSDGTPAIDTRNGEEGASVDHPIAIPDESADDFALLLSWVYTKSDAIAEFKNAEWRACLRLSHKFGIPTLGRAAQNGLQSEEFDPLEKVQLCFDYDLDLAWAKDSVSTICYGWNSLLLLDAANTLPIKFRLECMKLREAAFKAQSNPNGNGFHWCDGCGGWMAPCYRGSGDASGTSTGRERCIYNNSRCPKPALYIASSSHRDENAVSTLLSMFAVQSTQGP
ncbi:hypothetical protein DL96DRAFT_1476320, partial [Flagelloscypha sp. PMI_526]